MPTVLLTYAHGASLVDLGAGDSIGQSAVVITNSTSLPIPSRFPSTSTAQTTASPSGHIYLWCDKVNIVWEYDLRGRRVGEIVLKDGPVKRVLGAGKVNGKETAVVLHDQGMGVWQKASAGKWEVQHELEVPSGLVGLAADKDFNTLVALGSQEMLVYDMASGARESVFLAKELYREPAVAVAIPTRAKNHILVASGYTVLDVTKSESGKRVITEINAGTEAGNIKAICCTADTSQVGQPGRRCAVLREGGAVNLFGLDIPDGVAHTVTFGYDIVDIAFLGDGRLIGRTVEGHVLVQDIQKPGYQATFLETEHPVSTISVLPAMRVPESALKVRRSASASVLGEARNAGNIGITPILSGNDLKLKGKAIVDSGKNVRIVSAPPKIANLTAPRPSSSRSTSQPVQRPPRPSSSMAHLPAIEDVDEDAGSSEIRSNPVRDEQSLDLDWALRAREAPVKPETIPRLEASSVEELRREICNLQLDMLRMGRGLKNEIRNAIQPLVEELQEQRETNERQRREIERLRRGY